MKMYIAVLDIFPVYMTPTLVGHSVLGHHYETYETDNTKQSNYQSLYQYWFHESFKKCVVQVNRKEFDKIAQLPNVGLFHENKTLDGMKACAVLVVDKEIPNVLKFAKLWHPYIEN